MFSNIKKYVVKTYVGRGVSTRNQVTVGSEVGNEAKKKSFG